MGKPNYEFLIKKREDAGIKHFNDLNAFIECSNTMDDVYENMTFDDMIADIMTNKKFQVIIK